MRQEQHTAPLGRARFIAVCGCAGFIGGGVLGLLLGAAGGIVHLALYWHNGGEGAGTETILPILYAVPGAVLGAIAGGIGGMLLARRE